LCFVAFSVTVLLMPLSGIALSSAAVLLHQVAHERASGTSLGSPFQWALLALHLIPRVDDEDNGTFHTHCTAWLSMVACVLVSTLSLALLLRLVGASDWKNNSRTSVTRIAAVVAIILWGLVCVSKCRWPVTNWACTMPSVDALRNIPGVIRATCISCVLGALLKALAQLSACTSSNYTVTTCVALMLGPVAAVAELVCNGAYVPGVLALCGWIVRVVDSAWTLEQQVRGGGLHNSTSFCLLFMLDSARSFFALTLWGSMGKGLEALVTVILPTGLRVVAFDAPVDDLCGRLCVGVCLMLDGEQIDPGHVVLNVGHLPTADPIDIRSTVRASLRIMEELNGQTSTPGFVANVLCLLPEPSPKRSLAGVSWRSVREINLSVWNSHAAAAAWYRTSKAHRDIIVQHHDGGLRTFGNLLLSSDAVSLRYQRRCSNCRSVVEGLASNQCPECGSSTFPIPVF